jgi:tRNA (guanine37-N1)-methyltransferase
MRFHIITLFPDSLTSYLETSLLKRAQDDDLVAVYLYGIRDYTEDKHHTTDERPFGGGPGMVLKAEPILRAVEDALTTHSDGTGVGKKIKIVILSPGGKLFTQEQAVTYVEEYSDIVLIAGRYEGIDARVKEVLEKKYLVDEVSIGEYILTGGELPALVLIDAIIRHIPEVLGNEESCEEKRTATSEMYTRPEQFVWEGGTYSVPEVLRSGNHAEIEKWKSERK